MTGVKCHSEPSATLSSLLRKSGAYLLGCPHRNPGCAGKVSRFRPCILWCWCRCAARQPNDGCFVENVVTQEGNRHLGSRYSRVLARNGRLLQTPVLALYRVG